MRLADGKDDWIWFGGILFVGDRPAPFFLGRWSSDQSAGKIYHYGARVCVNRVPNFALIPETSTMNTSTLTPELLHKMDAYWRAANYLSVGQIYLCDNPLLQRPLRITDVKHMLLGHWGTTPGQNFIYVHLNRVIKKYDLDMIYVSGPGHGGPAVVGNTYLEGTYSEIYPTSARMKRGCRSSFFSFRFPAESPATPRRSVRARSTRAVSWATRSATRLGRCSTIPVSLSPASSAMARQKRDRSRRRGIPTSFSIRPPTGRCCRSFISTATRFPTRPSSPVSSARNWNSCSAATAGRPLRRRPRARADA